ncbi:uncharacterized protein [Temnothorax longispinosus]|uniref:uncharacterized protein n=1 Tax=Temnothorax longispinosus TaxID=300112 RepID=UPI003A9A4397
MRTYKRKSERAKTCRDVMEKACREIIFNKKGIIATAQEYDIPYRTLYRYVAKMRNKVKESPDITKSELLLNNVGYKKTRQIFTDEEENALAAYIKTVADINWMTPYKTRKFAYEFAIKNNKEIPDSWKTKEIAGQDWLEQFLKRKTITLSIRSSPEAKSLSRTTSFDRNNVNLFFNKLKAVYKCLHLGPEDIWNVDETGITTDVHVPDRIIARRDMRQSGKITSDERKTLVTVAIAVSALGNTIPPFFMFPRENYKDHFVQSGPMGSSGDANKSGWMKEENFIKFARHFVRYARPFKARPVLLLLDKHDLSTEVLDYFENNGVTVLSFPPHSSHKLQPLDRSVYGPLKKYYNTAADNWLACHPGKTISIYDIPELIKTSLPLATSSENVQSGFRVTGIYPLNENIFPESGFSGAYVTDKPVPVTDSSHIKTEKSSASETNENAIQIRSTSNTNRNDSLPLSESTNQPSTSFSPENIYDYFLSQVEQRMTSSY